MKYLGNSYFMGVNSVKLNPVKYSELLNNVRPKACSVNSCHIVVDSDSDILPTACLIDACGANACVIKVL